MYFLATTLDISDYYVGDEPCTDTYRDVVSKWHQDDCEEGRNSNSIIFPINCLDLGHHQEANDDERWSCCFVRNYSY